MEQLKRLIENERQALTISPVINQNVTRVIIIKEIEPKTLFDYAINNGLEKPALSGFGGYLQTIIHCSTGCAIYLQSKEVKTETRFSY